MSAAESLCVFEVDVDSTSCRSDARSGECVGGVEDSGEGINGLLLAVVEGPEVSLVTDLNDVGFGEWSWCGCVELQLELVSSCSDCVDQIRPVCAVDVELEGIVVDLSIGIESVFEVEVDAVIRGLVVAGADLV